MQTRYSHGFSWEPPFPVPPWFDQRCLVKITESWTPESTSHLMPWAGAMVFSHGLVKCHGRCLHHSTQISVKVLYCIDATYRPKQGSCGNSARKLSSMNTITITYMFIHSDIVVFRPFAKLSPPFRRLSPLQQKHISISADVTRRLKRLRPPCKNHGFRFRLSLL